MLSQARYFYLELKKEEKAVEALSSPEISGNPCSGTYPRYIT
jgi:hypothetical protein